MSRKIISKSSVPIIVSVVSILTVIFAVIVGMSTRSQVIQTRYYQFSCPQSFDCETTEHTFYAETILYKQSTCVGGVNQYSYFGTDTLKEQTESPNFPLNDVLQEMGLLEDGDTLDAYVMDIGGQDGTIFDLWEQRGESQRYHFFFPIDNTSLYDLWFDANAIDRETMHNVKNTFVVEDLL